MALTSDLKHVLENVFGCTYTAENPIILVAPIKFDFIEKDNRLDHEIQKVYLKGKSWKMVNEWSNEWTISSLDKAWQSNLYCNLLSMRDSRVNPVQYDLSL